MELLKINKSLVLIYGLPLLVILIASAISLSPLLSKYPSMSLAITFDLTLLAPMLFLILSRKRKSSMIKAVPIFILGIVTASLLLPKEEQVYLNIIKTYVLPLIEVGVLAFLILKVKQAVQILKKNTSEVSDFYMVCKKSAKQLFGKSHISSFIASETAMLYYAFSSWKKKTLQKNEYTNYQDNGSIPLLGAIIGIILVESVLFHVLLVYFEMNIFAWVLTLSSLYTGLLIFAHIRALKKRPSKITMTELRLKNGLLADITIKLSEIEKVELTKNTMPSGNLKIGNLGIAKESKNHNLALYFNSPQTIEKAYGFSTSCDVLLFNLDNKDHFVDQLGQAIRSN